MEDVLDIYERPYDGKHPVVCMDEKPYQLLGDARASWAMRPGDNRKIDSEYVRNGTCSIFAFVEPLGGRHHVSVKEHRTAIDWAHEIKFLVDEMYPDADAITLVVDNLNARARIPLQSLPAGGGTPDQEATGHPLHPQAWKLARHRGGRVERAHTPMPEPANRKHWEIARGTGRMGAATEPGSRKGGLAVQNFGRTHQAGLALPATLICASVNLPNH